MERAFEPMVHELAGDAGAARATSASEADPSEHGSGMPTRTVDEQTSFMIERPVCFML